MALAAGLKLGPYEIIAPIGAGGMGEVYRARDPRLGRDVAIKVLPAAFAKERDRLQRFEHEARAAGTLNHPGIVAIYDVGAADGFPYLVSELLEGESLRTVVDAGPVPPRRAAELAIQAARALAAAHARGIVHRDLKPENLHLLTDGRLKILDFGLAKLAAPDAPPRDDTGPQLQSLTMTGTILGTASYMAPEQIREAAVDHRADLFALGAIVYELVTGAKAFPGDTPADRMAAILTQQPGPLPAEIEAALPGLEAAIRRCLEKRPDDRFDSARDLAYILEILVAASERQPGAGARSREVRPDPRFHQLTYGEGGIAGARYASDGQTVVYAAAWNGGPFELYITRVGSHESRTLGLRDALLLDVSSSDEVAVLLRARDVGGFIELGVLARLPLMGGTPRELIDNVFQAGYGPGEKIAAIREHGGAMRLEYPIGTVLVETEGWMSDPRVSRDGRWVAFAEHPGRGDSSGWMAVVDARGGSPRRISARSPSIWGGAWTPDGKELFFSAQEPDGSNAVFASTIDGVQRNALPGPVVAQVEDISSRGNLLITSIVARMRMELGRRGGSEPTDLSWLDWSLARDITADGRYVLFDETGPSVGRPLAFLRGTDGAPAMRLGEGQAVRLSPDGRWALLAHPEDGSALEVVPTGAGQSTRHSLGTIYGQHGCWFPDGKALCILGNEPGRRTRAYRYDLETRAATPFAEEGIGISSCMISPDGRWMWTIGPSGHALYPVDGGEPRLLSGLSPEMRAVQWLDDGRSILAFERGRIPARVLRLDIESGRAEVWMEIRPSRTSGVKGVNSVCLTPDGEAYVTSYNQLLSDLYTSSGLL